MTNLRVRHLRRYGELGRVALRARKADPEALAAELEGLGPTFVKVGQLLSTRTDLLPPEYVSALGRLQDDLDPMPLDTVEAIVEQELGLPASDVYEWFDPEPLASASLGQVHRARLANGHEVVVKVQRPGVEECIDDDLAAFAELAGLADDHTELGRKVGFGELLSEFSRSLHDELDYRREASNLRRLHEIVEDYDRLVVPLPVDEATSRRVLTMDFVGGRKITEIGPLGRTDVDGPELARQLFSAYLDQILVHGFFHADPHPGNVLLTDDDRLVLLDLGMVARVAPRFQDALVRLLLSISNGNGEEAARIAIEMGHPLDDFDEDAFVRGAAALVERAHGSGMSEVESGTLVMELNRLAVDVGLRQPPELALLGKALLNLDRIADSLDPDFDPSACVQAHADDVLRHKIRPNRDRVLSAALEAREFVEELPARVNRLMDAAAKGELQVKVDAFDEQQLLRGLHQLANRVTMGLLLAALIIGAALLTRAQPTIATICFLLAAAGAAALLVTIALDGRRRRR